MGCSSSKGPSLGLLPPKTAKALLDAATPGTDPGPSFPSAQMLELATIVLGTLTAQALARVDAHCLALVGDRLSPTHCAAVCGLLAELVWPGKGLAGWRAAHLLLTHQLKTHLAIEGALGKWREEHLAANCWLELSTAPGAPCCPLGWQTARSTLRNVGRSIEPPSAACASASASASAASASAARPSGVAQSSRKRRNKRSACFGSKCVACCTRQISSRTACARSSASTSALAASRYRRSAARGGHATSQAD